VAIAIAVAQVSGAVPNTVSVVAGTGLTGGGALTGSVTLNALANSVNQNVTVQNNGIFVASQPAINFLPGANITITTANDTAGNRANVTIAVSGLGNMAFQSSSNVAITGGTINVTTVNHTANTASNVTYTSATMQLIPAGYINFDLNGVLVKIPYYNA